jgi:DNA-directed RNA polymerase subunit RPC12/RpoP
MLNLAWDSEMTASALKLLNRELPKSGINFVCSECGKLLCHIGAHNASSSSRQFEFAGKLLRCPECGRKLDTEIDPDRITIRLSG